MKFIKTSLLATVLVATAAASSAAPTQVNASKLKQIRKALNNGTTTVNITDAIKFKNSLEVNSDLTITTAEGDSFKNALTPKNKLKETAITVTDSTLKLKNLAFEGFKYGVLDTNKNANILTHNTVVKNNYKDGVGGAINNALGSEIRSESSTFYGNEATGNGGAINNAGKLTLLGYEKETDTPQLLKKIPVEEVTSNPYNTDSIFRNNVSGGTGGAVNNTGKLYVEGVRFVENEANGNGGAINNASKEVLTIRDSLFVDNISNEGNGGALANIGTAYAHESYFNGNSGKYGGAVYSQSGHFGTENSHFVNNIASAAGGAITNSSMSTLQVVNGRFVGNTVVNEVAGSVSGGAIYNAGYSYGIDGTFVNNSVTNASSSFGGAIYNGGSKADIKSITGLFNGNHVITDYGFAYGGAITNYTGGATIDSIDARFVNNYAKSNGRSAARGGAIFNLGEISEISGVFTNNYTESAGISQGGAIYNAVLDEKYNTQGYLKVVDTTFYKNGIRSEDNEIMTNEGGAIYNTREGTVLKIDASTFTQNAANKAGGAIFNDGGKVTLYNSTFRENTSKLDGGAIYNSGDTANSFLYGNTFLANTATNDGGAIFNADGTMEIQKTVFKKNTAENGEGGAILNVRGAETRLFGSTFDGNTAQGNGGAINNAGKLTVGSLGNGEVYSLFENNASETGSGGAIHNTGDLYVQQTVFKNNSAAVNGGAINNYFTNGLTMRDSLFEGNTAEGLGGALYNASTTTHILGSTFTGNKATSGGAIHNRSGYLNIAASDISDNAAVFTDNHATEHGGAISSSVTSKLNVEDALFARNSAVNSGGAINNFGSANNIIGEFTENSTAGHGGAIHNRGNVAIVNYIGGTFNGNFTQTENGYYSYGGAIANLADSAVIKKIEANFVNNYASSSGSTTVKGGAIMNQARISELTGTFAYNYTESNGVSQGGAIHNQKSHIYIPTEGYINVVDSTFYKNGIRKSDDMVMTKQGGAIFNEGEGAVLEISNSYFAGNAATNAGGAVYNAQGATATITDSSFVGNKATNGQGGAIANSGNLSIIAANDHIMFEANTDENGRNAIHNFETGIINLIASEDKAILINDSITGNGALNIGSDYSVNDINSEGWVVLNGDTSEYTGAVTLNNGTLRLGIFFDKETNVFSDFTTTGGTLDVANLFINKIDASKWNVIGQLNTAIDVNLNTKKADYFSGVGDKNITITDITLVDRLLGYRQEIDVAVADKDNAMSLAQSADKAYGLIFAYDVTSDKLQSDGLLTFNKNGLYNPLVLKNKAAGLSLINNVTDAIKNTFSPNRVSITSALGLATGDQPQSAFVSTWVETYYASDEVDLDGLTVDSDSYFTIVGGDIAGANFGSWSSLYSIYSGYIGSTQDYSDVEIDQNGLIVGASLTLENDNWYTVFNSNGTFNFLDSQSSAGSDEFNMFSLSVANKTGVKLYAPGSSFYFEPSLAAGYHFIHTEDYVNASDVKIESDGLHIFNVVPEIKVGLDLEGFFKPYVSAAYNWNFETGGDVTANDVLLPNLSVDEYAELRLGADFEFEGGFDAFIEGQASLGDRDGFGVQAGIKWNF